MRSEESETYPSNVELYDFIFRHLGSDILKYLRFFVYKITITNQIKQGNHENKKIRVK